MTKMLNVESQDGRNQNSFPKLDEVRSQFGASSGAIANTTSTSFLTIPAGRVFQITSIVVSSHLSAAYATSAVRILYVASATTSTPIHAITFTKTTAGGASPPMNYYFHGKGPQVVASTVTPYYIRATAQGASAFVFVGGFLRSRTNADVSS